MPETPLQDNQCRRCQLWENAKSVCVPGEGPLDSSVLVVGISPGGWEDSKNRPFVGESGRLLRAVLLANGLAEVDPDFPELPKPLVRLTNTTRCRPPENRDPTAEETRACRTYLDSELSSMPNLKYVVALGTLPMKAMGVVGSVTDLAGVPRKSGVLTVIPVFHPAAVLRRRTYLSTWESHWHGIRNIVFPLSESFATRLGATIYPNGLEGKDWRSL